MFPLRELARTPNVAYRRTVVGEDVAGLSIRDACVALGLAAPDEIETRLQHGGVWRDKWRVNDADELVAVGAMLTVHLPPGDVYPDVYLSDAQIIYEDAALVVLNKPPGLYVHATPWDTAGNVLWALEQWLARRDGIQYPLHLAHQLDRDTSGVLVVTKDARANAPLQHAFSSHAITKTYLGICTGQPAETGWTTETGHGRGAHGLFRVYPLEQVGQPLPVGNHRIKYMRTDFRMTQTWQTVSLIEALPQTGRTHQIRLHLHAADHPLLGDARYGGPLTVGGVAVWHHLLHAQRLQLHHPLTHAPLDLSAPSPPLFRQVISTFV